MIRNCSPLKVSTLRIKIPFTIIETLKKRIMKIYYVVEKHTRNVGDDIQELNGLKTITAYTIEENDLELFFDVEGSNSESTEEMINEYLDDNGYGDTEHTLKQL